MYCINAFTHKLPTTVTGKTFFTGGMMATESHVKNHKVVTDAVHEHRGAIAMQILHVGR